MRNECRSNKVLVRLGVSVVASLILLGPAKCRTLNAQPDAPHINYLFPPGSQRGTTFETTVGGLNLEGTSTIRITGQGVTAEVIEVKKLTKDKKKKVVKTQTGDQELEIARISVTIAPDAELGQRDLRLVTPHGISNRFRFFVGQVPEVKEVEPNSEKSQAQRLESLPVLVNGQIMSGDRDFFRFWCQAGQTLVCQVQARTLLPYIADAVPGWLQSSLTLYDAGGRQLKYVDDFRFKPDPVLVYKVPKDAEYLLEIKDVIYRGREDFLYRLSIGDLPFITHIFPLGGQRNAEAQVQLHGVNLSSKSMNLTIPGGSPAVRYVGLSSKGLSPNVLPFSVDDRPEVRETESNDSAAQANRVEPPVIINGRIQQPGDVDYFAFRGRAKQKLVIEVRARRLDSPIDSIITVLNRKGRELAENDDTVDKGEGLIMHHADSRLEYTFPAKGDYLVRIKDVQGKGGEEYAYRLVIGPRRPDFDLRIVPDNPRVGQGGTAAITVHALRKDGFNGEIDLSLRNLPDGFVISNAQIPAGQDQVRFTITAPNDAPLGVISPTIVGTATIGEQATVREAVPAEELTQAFGYKHLVPTKEFLLTVMKPVSFVLTPDIPHGDVLDVRQGGSVKIVVKALRREGAKGVISLKADEPPKGMNVRRAVISKDKDEALLTISVTKQLRVGFRQNIVLTGSVKAGKETVTCVVPAIPIRVVAAKQ